MVTIKSNKNENLRNKLALNSTIKCLKWQLERDQLISDFQRIGYKVHRLEDDK